MLFSPPVIPGEPNRQPWAGGRNRFAVEPRSTKRQRELVRVIFSAFRVVWWIVYYLLTCYGNVLRHHTDLLRQQPAASRPSLHDDRSGHDCASEETAGN